MPKGSSWVMKTLMQLRRRIGKHQHVQEEQTSFKEGQSAKPDPAAKFELLVTVKGRERSTIPSIYAQGLLMGHENIDATA